MKHMRPANSAPPPSRGIGRAAGTRISTRLRTLCHALLLTAALAAAIPDADAAAALPQYFPDTSLGVASCSNSLCHGSSDYWKDSNVLQNEYRTWQQTDKHARAYAVLMNEQSRQIAKKLGLRTAPERADLCLDCHAHNVPATHRGAKFVLADGVTCEACHGPAQRWVRSHVEAKATHARNRLHGLYPTEDPVARARLCLSCHFGNSRKFVTHRMMAAGHPRMSFELDTFGEIAPAHWRIDADWIKRKGEWDGVRAWAAGQAVAAQELIRILVDPRRGRDGLFPELVLFDCHACHHSMADKRMTAEQMHVGPGLVRLNDASLLLLRHIARRVDPAGADAFGTQVRRLRQAVAGGDDGIAEAGATLHALDALLEKIAQHAFGTADLRAMLRSLIADGLAGQYVDYQGAEQVTMATQSLAAMLARRGELRAATVGSAMRGLLATVADDEKYQPTVFQAALRELNRALEEGMRE